MENKGWFIHVEWVVVLVTVLGGFYTINANMKSEILEIRQEFCSQHQAQVQRTDRLYEMFIDLIKSEKKA